MAIPQELEHNERRRSEALRRLRSLTRPLRGCCDGELERLIIAERLGELLVEEVKTLTHVGRSLLFEHEETNEVVDVLLYDLALGRFVVFDLACGEVVDVDTTKRCAAVDAHRGVVAKGLTIGLRVNGRDGLHPEWVLPERAMFEDVRRAQLTEIVAGLGRGAWRLNRPGSL